MRNIRLVAVREFKEHVRNRGFIISSIIVPLIIIVIWLATGVFEIGNGSVPQSYAPPPPDFGKSQGFVDQSGLIQEKPASLPVDLLRMFPDVASADQALISGSIDAYYLIPADYLRTGKIRRVSLSLPSGSIEDGDLTYFLVGNLLPQADPEQLSLLRNPLGPAGPQFVSIEKSEEIDSKAEAPAGTATRPGQFSFTPFLVTFVIIMPLFISGGYLLQSLAQEKSSRVMEILLVSLQPRQLLMGKLIGLGALTLVQYIFWILVVGAALLLSGQNISQMLSGINIDPQEVVYMILFALGGFALYASFMAGLGALSPNLEGGRSWVLLISLPMMIPIYLWVAIAEAPHGILAMALSLIPLTAPVAMLMRITTSTVPTWQIGLSLALLALTSVGIVWLMARLFRVQTLLSGEAVSVKRFWQTVRG